MMCLQRLQCPWTCPWLDFLCDSCRAFSISCGDHLQAWIQQDVYYDVAYLGLDLDGGPCGLSCLVPHLSSLSFLPFLGLWPDLSSPHGPEDLPPLSLPPGPDDLPPLEHDFLCVSLGPLHFGKCFFICCLEDAVNSRHFPQEKLLQ